jgi:hypothetical protein
LNNQDVHMMYIFTNMVRRESTGMISSLVILKSSLGSIKALIELRKGRSCLTFARAFSEKAMPAIPAAIYLN